MQRETDLTPDPFDTAAKAALRNAPLPAPPAWMDAQITAAAHAQAQVAAGKHAASQTERKVRGLPPWLKFALPTLAVATLLISVWLPQTEVNQGGITLPDAARVDVPAQPPALASAPATPSQPVAAEPAESAAPASAVGSVASTPASTPASKPAAPKPAARAAAPTAAAKEKLTAPRAEVANDAVQFAGTPQTPAPAPPPAAPAAAPTATVFAEEKAAQEQARSVAGTERTTDAKAAPPVIAAGAATTGRTHGSVMTAAPSEQAAPAPQLRASTAMNRTRAAPVAPSVQAELESIRTLMREGKRDEAAKRLLALKEREPQLDIPVDLRDLLPRP